MFEHSKQGAIDVVSGRDSLNADYVESASRAVQECLDSGQPRIVFDLEAVPLIDSEGLRFLLDARDECQRRGGAMHLASPNKLCKDILRITGIRDEFEVHDDVLTAVGSFAL